MHAFMHAAQGCVHPPVGQLMGLPSISRGEEAKLEEPAQFMSQCQPGPHPFSWQRPLWCFRNRVTIPGTDWKKVRIPDLSGVGFYAASIGTDVGRRLPVGGASGGSSVGGDLEGSAA